MSRARAWAEVLRVSGLLTVPGDVVAGVAAAGGRPEPRVLRAIGCSLCLYEAGMALNDWADQEEDARERPHRPLPSGRLAPAPVLGAAIGLTAAGIALAATAGRHAALVAGTLAATVWAYDLKLKHTKAGPAAMGAARGLDLLLGAVTAGRRNPGRTAWLSAAALAAHTAAVTHVSRSETTGGDSRAPLAALAATAGIGLAVRGRADARGPAHPASRVVPAALAAAYAATAARPLAHAVLNPSPPLVQRAVGGGLRALIPLQGALTARAGSPALGAALLVGAPIVRRLARRVGLT
ncbi:SCO3242 family prenyltransferase [Streptomyces sp. NPDC012421]|uniref:SCO3242 family prenyltransferase n=1 Tax=Streptomyces sp. NPDC012421 TaxID=3364832 RepID=UPI0036E1B79B